MSTKISRPMMEDSRPLRLRRPRPTVSILIILGMLYTFYSLRDLAVSSGPWASPMPQQAAPRTDARLETRISGSKSAAGATGVVKSTETARTAQRVPLEAHIMSKCPDAKDCLRELVLPAMQQVIDQVDFTLSFIGTPTENDGVSCMHGPDECMGNILELCARELYPDPKIYLGFTMCLTRDYSRIPQRELVEDCALEHAVSVSKLNECATRDDGGYGVGLLRSSVQRTKDAAVTKSCTVRLDNEIYCVRDNAEWKDCPHGPGVDELVSAVDKLFKA